MLISIIIPTYNEEKTIIKILNQINSLNIWSDESNFKNYDKEIIIIDDGSSDKTINLLKQNQNLYTKLLINKSNKGKGFSVKEGLKVANGEYIIFQDADDEYDPKDYIKFINCAVQFDADFVIGSRFNYDKFIRSHNFFNKIGNKIITLFFNIVHNTTFNDIYCCYIFFKKNILQLEKINSEGFEQHAEILCNLKKNGNKFYEVPVNYNGRTITDGKKIRFYHIFPIFYQILKSKFKS